MAARHDKASSKGSASRGKRRRMEMTEAQRTELIGQIANVLRNGKLPAEARQAGLTLIGWLARRMPQDRTKR
jgi:hypothetical protein